MTNCAQRSGGVPLSVVGWIHNFAVKNYWRVSAFYELDDLCQDGLVCAVKCRNRYGTPGVEISHPHFMSLVQTAFTRYLIDLTRRQLVTGPTVYLADLGTDEIAVREKHSVPDYPIGELVRCIEELPDYLYKVLMCLLTDPGYRRGRRDERDLRLFLCD
jgi:DNA-directed RNA polymerase specialized sigma24 family protein